MWKKSGFYFFNNYWLVKKISWEQIAGNISSWASNITQIKKILENSPFLSKQKETRVGIVITKNNAYLMRYFSKKFVNVTFFMLMTYAILLTEFTDGATVTHTGELE